MLAGKLKGFEKFTDSGIYVVNNHHLMILDNKGEYLFDIPKKTPFIFLEMLKEGMKINFFHREEILIKICFEGKVGFVSDLLLGDWSKELDIVRIK